MGDSQCRKEDPQVEGDRKGRQVHFDETEQTSTGLHAGAAFSSDGPATGAAPPSGARTRAQVENQEMIDGDAIPRG